MFDASSSATNDLQSAIAANDSARANRDLATVDAQLRNLDSSINATIGVISQFGSTNLQGPLATVRNDEQLEHVIRTTAVTAHHPAGTCRMGAASDPMAVVDAELRVYGTEGLRVVDASVFPDLVGGNINAAVVMIAERASDLIRGRERLDVGVREIGSVEMRPD